MVIITRKAKKNQEKKNKLFISLFHNIFFNLNNILFVRVAENGAVGHEKYFLDNLFPKILKLGFFIWPHIL